MIMCIRGTGLRHWWKTDGKLPAASRFIKDGSIGRFHSVKQNWAFALAWGGMIRQWRSIPAYNVVSQILEGNLVKDRWIFGSSVSHYKLVSRLLCQTTSSQPNRGTTTPDIVINQIYFWLSITSLAAHCWGCWTSPILANSDQFLRKCNPKIKHLLFFFSCSIPDLNSRSQSNSSSFSCPTPFLLHRT
jgi:hypothetical protein